VSNPLGIVRLIDARLAVVPAIIARSKQTVIAVEKDLDQHRKWVRRHRDLSAADLKRHQRRLRRRRVIGACQRAARTLVLLVPSLGMALLRGAAQDLISLGGLLWSSCSWIAAKANGLERWLTGRLAIGVYGIARGLDALGVWLVDLLSLGATSAGSTARRQALRLIHQLWQTLSWAGTEVHALGLGLAELVKRHVSQFFVRRPALDDQARDGANARIEPELLDLQRLQEAAFVRLRAEHEGLQNRIHAVSGRYGQRVVNGGLAGGGSSHEWVQLRTPAENAGQLFETQRLGVLNSALSIASEASSRPTGRALSDGMAETGWRTLPSAPALSARARVVYGTMLPAPALVAGNARTEPRNRRRALRGDALIEQRALLPVVGVLAAAFLLAVIGSQAPAADPHGDSAKDDGATTLAVVAAVADETRVSIVAKAPKSAPPAEAQSTSLDPGFGTTTAGLEPLPVLAITVPSLMVMANFAPVAAATEPAATPTRVAAVPRAVTPKLKSKPKPAVPEPQQQASWYRPSWLRLPWSSARVEADTKLGFQSSR
jgi:hypothetical protein